MALISGVKAFKENAYYVKSKFVSGNEMSDKAIDKIRNAAGSMQIGTSGDQSDITTLLSLRSSLYAVKEKGI